MVCVGREHDRVCRQGAQLVHLYALPPPVDSAPLRLIPDALSAQATLPDDPVIAFVVLALNGMPDVLEAPAQAPKDFLHQTTSSTGQAEPPRPR